MSTCDERPLAELRFANHILDEAERTQVEAQVRELLQDTVEVAQNLIDQGCVGLYDHFAETVGMNAAAIKTVRFILTNIGGSGTGLPCHVPPNEFCLIHNCVGGRELGQKWPVPQHRGMTRDLTEEEKKNSLAVRIFTEQQAAKELETHFQAKNEEKEKALSATHSSTLDSFYEDLWEQLAERSDLDPRTVAFCKTLRDLELHSPKK